MNNARRNEIIHAATRLALLAGQIRECHDAIQSARDDEQEAFDARSEGWQQGDAGQEAQAGLDAIDEALDALDTLDLAKISERLQEAIDRNVEALPDATLTEEEADARRWDRLPQWAKDQIGGLTNERDGALEQAKAIYPDADPDRDDQFIIRDYNSPFDGKALPFQRIELRGVEITTRRDYCEGVQIRTGWGGLAIQPSSGNEIIVRNLNRK